ncbi:hypothetical protein LOK49_LG02G01913 [Camellia lanceoleosa]|uniref:Uncharacterized protein n=1 Tax=Camellia lanceoleosa TaxID=1840588 RepID=A0ACC0ISH9_9ERIC|nr:hypothetical protein LOK49_LG02G01913 [Camellia lanceoleosa]
MISRALSADAAKVTSEEHILSAKFAGAANLPFLLLQIPQIVLNARNLLAGNKTALLAVPWLGMFTGLLGNLSLLSYFAKKKEKEAVVVQTLGVISIYVVIAQLAMAEAMPLPHFIATSIVVASGLALNFLNYFDLLSAGIWRFWEDFITVAGLSVLPQRIRIEGIKNDPWFRKNYVAVEHGGDEDVNLDNVHTVFDDIETRLEGMSVNKIGQFAVVLEVFEVAPFLFMVDVRKATGDTNEYQMVSLC